MTSSEDMARITFEIPLKLPSLNDYVKACRSNKFAGGNMKKKYETLIIKYLQEIPKFNNPITINFHWVESNHKRDLDNIAFAKKFILDAMQKNGNLINDNAEYVKGFTDTFEYSKENKIIITIIESKI